MLLLTLVIMGIGTALIGLLPTYDQIGVWAPIALVVLRVLQGIGVGGEYGGAVLLAVEYAPAERRGFFGSFAHIGVPGGLVLAASAFSIAGQLPEEDFLAWGWRVCFLVSIVLLGIGAYIRLSVMETPEFAKVQERKEISRLPLRDLLAEQPRPLLLGMGTRFIEGFTFNLFSVYLLAYVATNLELPRSWALDAIIVGAALGVVLVPIAGALSDRVGRKPVYRVGAWLGLLFAFPAAWLIQTEERWAISLVFVVGLGAIYGIVYGPLAAFWSELFDTRYRYTALSTLYQVSGILASGLTPLIAAWLVTKGDGTLWWVAGYNVAVAAISLVCAHFLPETRGRGLDREDVGGRPRGPRARHRLTSSGTRRDPVAGVRPGRRTTSSHVRAPRRPGLGRLGRAPGDGVRRARPAGRSRGPAPRRGAARRGPWRGRRGVPVSAFIPPDRPARKPAGSSSFSFFSTTLACLAEMSTVMVDSEVWSVSHDCCDFSESSSAWRVVSCDSIQMRFLSDVASASSSSTRLRLASCARTRTSLSMTCVVTSSEPRLEATTPSTSSSADMAALNFALGTRITKREYDASPSSSVSVFSSVTSPPCASTIRCTSWRVPATSLLDSETVPLEITARSICGVVATFAPRPDAGADPDELEVAESSAAANSRLGRHRPSRPSDRLAHATRRRRAPASLPPLEEQAARTTVMVRAVRTPAARVRVVMPVRRGAGPARFRP